MSIVPHRKAILINQRQADEYVREGVPTSLASAAELDPVQTIEKLNSAINAASTGAGRLDDTLKREQSLHSALMKTLQPVKYGPASNAFPDFTVTHYAQPVTYSVRGLLADNLAKCAIDVPALLTISELDGIRQVVHAPKNDGIALKKAKNLSLLERFSFEIAEFVRGLSSCGLHWIRCVKPVDTLIQKGHPAWDRMVVLRQLHSCGVIDTIKVYAAGWTSRQTVTSFGSQ